MNADLNLEIMRGGVLYLDSKGNVAGGGMYRVEIIAQLFGVTVRRIQQLTQEGVLPTTETTEGRRYDLVPTTQNYVKYLSDKAYGKNRGSDEEIAQKSRKIKAEADLKEAQGELARLKNDIARGKYIPVEEAILDYQKFFVTFKKFATSLPSRLVGFITGYVDPVEARRIEKDLSAEVHRLLGAFVLAGITDAPQPKQPEERAIGNVAPKTDQD